MLSLWWIFLDLGELEVIRDNFLTEERRDAYVNDVLAEISDFAQAQKDQIKRSCEQKPSKR